jgi:hypothetical protein
MRILRTAEELKQGDILSVLQTDEAINDWLERTEKVKAELKELPAGQRYIDFYMKKNGRNYHPNTKIIYKREVIKFHPIHRAPIYKSHGILIQKGRHRSSIAEQIAFLDMDNNFLRKSEVPLTKLQQEQVKVLTLQQKYDELKATLDSAMDKINKVEQTKEINKPKVKGNQKKVGRETKVKKQKIKIDEHSSVTETDIK